MFTPIWGEIPNLTNIFQMGWFNHQPVMIAGSLETSWQAIARIADQFGFSVWVHGISPKKAAVGPEVSFPCGKSDFVEV